MEEYKGNVFINSISDNDIEKIKTRFLNDVFYSPDGCWLWVGNLSKSGYGRIAFGRANIRAHRLSYRLFNGLFDTSLLICHHCDVRICVNPDHLFIGTHMDNTIDKVKKDRHYKSPQGELSKNAKLKSDDIHNIRMLRSNGMPLKKLSIMYKISQSLVSLISNRKAWRHLK